MIAGIRRGIVIANLETAAWALSRARSSWGDGVRDDIRQLAAQAAEAIEEIARYMRTAGGAK